MPFVHPENHQRDLRTRLEMQGWEIEQVEPEASQWWLHTLWRIRSRWRPAGLTAWLAFIRDPMEPDSGKCYAIALGRARPGRLHDREQPDERFGLSPNWDEELERVIAAAEKLRG
jgi:hypothetical protein